MGGESWGMTKLKYYGGHNDWYTLKIYSLNFYKNIIISK